MNTDDSCYRTNVSVGLHLLPFFFPMEHEEIQRRCEAFLKELNIPSFVVFGWKKTEAEFGVVSSYHEMPANAAIKGMSWALNDYISRTM